MHMAQYGEETTWHHSEAKPWDGYTQPTSYLEGTWVNAECANEHYIVRGVNVTRTDARGAHHFTLQWDDQRQRWLWGTRGRLFLLWHSDNAIAWVPNMVSQNDRVWEWRRVSHPALWHDDLMPPPECDSSSYGFGRRPRANRYSEPYPHSAAVGSLRMLSSTRSYRAPRGWDSSDALQQHDHSHQYRYDDFRYRSHIPRYSHERRNFQDDYHSHHIRRSRSDLSTSAIMPCGLTSNEIYDLLTREITPEDYDLLLSLDQGLPKPTASLESVAALPEVLEDDFMDRECSVCLSPFENDDAVVALPCKHLFHRCCVTKWLSECRKKCPLCGLEVTSS